MSRHPRTRLGVGAACVVLAVAAGAGIFALSAGGRSAAVACGDTVTSNVTLTSDLSCTGDGLIVGADSITINLNSHTIDGDDGAGDYGIDNSGYDQVTVKNGKITDFDNAVRLNDGANGNKIKNLTIRSTSGHGIRLVEAGSSTVDNNGVFDSGDDGIRVDDDSTGNKITNNRVVRTNSSVGIHLGGDGNTASGNIIAGTDDHGIDASGNESVITGNTIYDPNGWGIHVTGNNATVNNNDVERAHGQGIQLQGSDNTQVVGNRVVGADQKGLDVFGPSENVLLKNNILIGNNEHGMQFTSGSGTVKGNQAYGNKQSGIVICDPDVTFTGNTAKYNRQHGFVTDGGVTDGGGNTAVDNGLDPQWDTSGCE